MPNRYSRVILASASPRRRELLKQIIPEFEIAPAEIDEDALTVEDPFLTAEGLALAKAAQVAQKYPDALVIGSDTVVAIELQLNQYEQLAKPNSEQHAYEMLRKLAGRTHLVVTGVCLYAGMPRVFYEVSEVEFAEISDAQIRDYISTGSPFDKAGGYGAQDESAGFIKEIRGSYSNVIGLPLEKLESEMKKSGLL